MNKYKNPRLLNAVVAGTGTKHPVRPHVVLGNAENGFIVGDIMDANAVIESIKAAGHPDMNNDISELKKAIEALKQSVNTLTTKVDALVPATKKETSDALISGNK